MLDNQSKLVFDEKKLVRLNYRPFDERWTYFDNKVLWRWREELMKCFLKDNVGFLLTRNLEQKRGWADVIVVSNMSTHHSLSIKEVNYLAPLFLYLEDGTKTANLKPEIVKKIQVAVGEVSPEDIFDYIYAVLHSPGYREKYKEFLKVDFPRVPYPKDAKSFRELAAFGAELRGLHLMESSKFNRFITSYPVEGNNLVEKPIYKDGKVHINKTQYFGGVPEVAWNFYIGGYQPAQKWLKDRKGRELADSDLEHYQKIIVALTETDRIMKEIDAVFEF